MDRKNWCRCYKRHY